MTKARRCMRVSLLLLGLLVVARSARASAATHLGSRTLKQVSDADPDAPSVEEQETPADLDTSETSNDMESPQDLSENIQGNDVETPPLESEETEDQTDTADLASDESQDDLDSPPAETQVSEVDDTDTPPMDQQEIPAEPDASETSNDMESPQDSSEDTQGDDAETPSLESEGAQDDAKPAESDAESENTPPATESGDSQQDESDLAPPAADEAPSDESAESPAVDVPEGEQSNGPAVEATNENAYRFAPSPELEEECSQGALDYNCYSRDYGYECYSYVYQSCTELSDSEYDLYCCTGVPRDSCSGSVTEFCQPQDDGYLCQYGSLYGSCSSHFDGYFCCQDYQGSYEESAECKGTILSKSSCEYYQLGAVCGSAVYEYCESYDTQEGSLCCGNLVNPSCSDEGSFTVESSCNPVEGGYDCNSKSYSACYSYNGDSFCCGDYASSICAGYIYPQSFCQAIDGGYNCGGEKYTCSEFGDNGDLCCENSEFSSASSASYCDSIGGSVFAESSCQKTENGVACGSQTYRNCFYASNFFGVPNYVPEVCCLDPSDPTDNTYYDYGFFFLEPGDECSSGLLSPESCEPSASGGYTCESSEYNGCYTISTKDGDNYCCDDGISDLFSALCGPFEYRSSCNLVTDKSSSYDQVWDCAGSYYSSCTRYGDNFGIFGDLSGELQFYCCSGSVSEPSSCPDGETKTYGDCTQETSGDSTIYVCSSAGTEYTKCEPSTSREFWCCKGTPDLKPSSPPIKPEEIDEPDDSDEEETTLVEAEDEVSEPTDTARSLGVASLDIPAAPPLPPPPPYDPEVSPQVKVQVGAQLPGDVPCDDLSGDQLEDLAVSYCLKILELAGLGDLFFAGQCSASCGVSSNSRKMLQVNPVLFDIDFVRANEDPAAVDAANGEAQELESILEDDSLLSTALEQTLPGTTVTSQEVSASLAEPSEGTGGGQEGIPAQGAPPAAASNQTSTETPNARNNSNCTDIPTPGEYTCEQQKAWGKCTAGFMLKGDFCSKTCGRCGGTEEYCTNLPTPDGYTCEQQKGWGKCTADFMLQGGFCAKTCGRC